MTMRELARLANVSVSTVSKAFGDADDVCAETKAHIFQIAKEYGCYGKFYKGKFSKRVYAIICSELISNYYIGFVERLQTFIEENGGIAVVSVDHFDAKKQAELIEYYVSYLHVDGIVVFDLKTPVKKGYDIPIISLFSTIDTNVDSVNLNLKTGMEEAVAQLYALGHRKIGFISEPLTQLKATCFQTVCSGYADISTVVYQSNYRFERAGQDGVSALLDQKCECTALICAYDNVAIGAMQQLKKQGLSVPGDVSVIGCDNINTSAFMETSLTSIDSCPDELCMTAWDLLQKKQKNKYYRSNRDITIKGVLVLRESVGPVPPQKTNG